MIIYFCDRQFNILGQASTELPAGYRISEDNLVEDVESGVNSFECTITWTDATRTELESAIIAGNYILKSGSEDNNYNALFQIVETEADTKEQSIRLYAEDAGLDLLNTQCDAVALNNKTIRQMMAYFLPSDWTLNVQDAPTNAQSNEWDGSSTCTERLLSVVGLWGCELYYTFRVEGLQVKEKIVNVVKKRGLQEAIPQLRLNYDIDRIVTKTSIADLVTALNVTGGTPEGSETPINLKNYDYSYTDPTTGDVYRVDKTTGQMRNTSAMQRWSSMIDSDGLWVGTYSYDTTNKAELAGQARAELQKKSAPAVNYEVDFANLPEDAQIGDRVNIIDDDGELYLDARLLQIETSEADGTKKATIGEYLLKSAGITEKVLDLAQQVREQSEADARTKEQIQILTESVDNMLTLEVASNIIQGQAFLKAKLLNGNKDVTEEHSPALFKWILRKDTGERLLGRGYTLNVDLATMGYAGTILCRFIRPELYDLTDHNLTVITDQDGNAIQVSYAGLYSQPTVQRASRLKALRKASFTANVLTEETGYATLSREVNLYERGNLDNELKSTLQYFWTEQEGYDAGAHITEVTKEEFEADPENGGGNLLARSDGIAVRDGLTELATFTADGSRIGETGKARVETNAEGTTIYSNYDGVSLQINGLYGMFFRDNYTADNGIGRISLAGYGETDPDTQEFFGGNVFNFLNASGMAGGIPRGGVENTMVGTVGNAKSARAEFNVKVNSAGTESSTITLRAEKVYANGNLLSSSDARLKEHIKYLDEDAAEFCRKLRPAVFIKDNGKHLGLYAQDVKAVNEWGADIVSIDTDGYLGLSYTELIAPLVAYCQSLERRIKELEDK